MQIPKLRFKEFTNQWQEKKLGNMCEVITKGTTPSNFNIYGINFIRVECIENNTINLNKCLYISKKVHENELKRSILKENDILFVIAGATIGKNAIISSNLLPANTNQALSIIRLNKNYNNKFILYILNSNIMKKYIYQNISIGAQPNLSLEQISNFLLYLPSVEEQTKIADFLSLIDRKIELQEELVNHLNLYNKGLLQKVFSNNKGWKTKKLADFLISNSKIPVENTSKYRKLTIKLNFQGLEENITKRTMLDTRPFYVRNQGEIIVGKQNYFNGSIAIVPKKFDKYICSNAIMSFSVSNANKYFIYYQISQNDYINKRSYMANGTGQKELSEKDFLNFDIKMPSLEEQNKIANLFTNLDKKIDFETKKLKNLKQYKKGLLQKMFI